MTSVSIIEDSDLETGDDKKEGTHQHYSAQTNYLLTVERFL
jgi:hypothetical protein